MYPNRSESSHKRQHGDRSSRQWDEYDDRRDERREPRRDVMQDSYHKYGGDGHSSTERTSRSREYSDSPQMLYSKDSKNRDWSRKSPVRRTMSSPVWDASEKHRQRIAEDDESDYSYRCEPQEKTYRQSADKFLRAHLTKDFKDTPPRDEDYKYRKTPQDTRQRHEEFTYRQRHEDLTYRRLSGGYKERAGRERSRDRSQERTRSQDGSAEKYAKTREKTDSTSTSTYHEEHHQNRTKFPQNGSSGQLSFESDVSTHSTAVPEPRSTKGFQRFLDVLNKGVNVDVLTKIVTQTPESGVGQSPSPLMNAADCPWSPGHAGRQQESQQNNCYWRESKAFHRQMSPRSHHRSLSPKRCPLSDNKPLQESDDEQSDFKSRSKSPSAVEKNLTPEDEHKHRQMQDVLQAIGMDLGFEELGQMSNRIQERLYGRKDSDRGRKVSREGGTRRDFSPRRQSKSSSSSRSSFSPLTQDYYNKKDSYSGQRDGTEVHQVKVLTSVEYCQKTSSSSVLDSEKCETNSQESTAALQAFPPNSTYTVPEPPPAPVMPTYSPVNCSPLPYTALPPPPALPPIFSPVAPGVFLPCPPPFLPYPPIPPLNIFPPGLAQTRHPFPQHTSNPQPPFFSLPDVKPVNPLSTTQKSKNVSRPRCLQVIETKQPG